MRAYSIDLRQRALIDCDEGMPTKQVAARYRVSAAWARRLKQRRRETGSIALRPSRYTNLRAALDLLLDAANAEALAAGVAQNVRWRYRDAGLLSEKGIEGHGGSPTVENFDGDGMPDSLGGAEERPFFYMENPRRSRAPRS